MHIIDSDGKITEGQPLTRAEVEILSELSETGINAAASSTYIPERDARKIALYLISNFALTRRVKPEDSKPIAEVS